MLVKRRIVLIWMIIGLFMIFFQIIIGGVTRLTGSGLSITKWEIITGTIPPLNEAEWNDAYTLYKGTPQYTKINNGMTLSEFKFIYFWEYLHRLWARLMGIVFIVPFLIFLTKQWLDRKVIRMLIVVVLSAGLVGVFGWIMVASGLINRPWVNAYKLSIHLSLALIVYTYLLWTILTSWFPGVSNPSDARSSIKLFFILLTAQLFLGGMMSGMKAALVYPTWPLMHGEFIPAIILDLSAWNVDNFVDYDQGPFLIALVQFVHRSIGYLLVINALYIIFSFYSIMKERGMTLVMGLFITMLIIQIGLGISVLLKSIGTIPVLIGVLHQAVAILVLTLAVILYYFHSFNSLVSSPLNLDKP